MMKEQVKKTKLKGTVLYTVISVLMVLIVFLMGTLALAATASNRAMNNYNSAQTQYTAKAGVQAVMAAMQNDKDVAAKVASISAANPSASVTVSFGVTDEDAAEAASLGRITSAKVEYAGTKWVLNEDEEDENYGLLEEKVVVKISATAEQGQESSTVSAYVLKDAKPQENSSGGGGGFVSTGSAENGTHTSAFGGTYIGFDNLGIGADMKVVNAASVFESDFHVNGTLDVTVNMDLVIKQPGTGLTVWEDLLLNNSGITVSSVNATKDVFNNEELPYTDIPYIYVDGKISSSNSITLGDPTGNIPLNIFCGSIETDVRRAGTNNNIYADVYCYDAAATSILAGNESRLYSWIANVMDANDVYGEHVAGNFYTKGHLYIPAGNSTQTIDGEVYVAGNMTVDKETIVYGDVWVGGTLTLNAKLTVKNGTVHCDGIVNEGNIDLPLPDGVVYVAEYEKIKDSTDGHTYEEVANIPATLTIGPDNIGRWFDGYGAELGNIGDMANFETVLDAEGNPQYYNIWGKNADGSWMAWALQVPPVWTGYYMDGVLVDRSMIYETIPEHYEKEGSWVDVEARSVDTAYDGSESHFPKEYEKDVILGNTILEGKDSTASTKIITTVDDVMASNINPYNTITEVPDTYQTDVATNVYDYSGEGNMLKSNITITESCTIFGKIDNNYSITFKVDTGEEIWVVLGNGTTGLTCRGKNQLILDRSDPDCQGTLNILINGDVEFFGNSDTYFPIITSDIQSLMETGSEFQIFTDSKYKKDGVDYIDAIKINIYCAKNNGNGYSLNINNATLVTANITSPYLTLGMGSGGYSFSNDIYYNKFNIKDDYSTGGSRIAQLGCIGCCVIKELTEQANDFTLLYVPKDVAAPDDDDFDDALMTGWRVLYYENY